MDNNNFIKNTLDEIPTPNANAKQIIGLVKNNGRVRGYKLSDERFVSKEEAVRMAKQGEIRGVGIAHRGETEYLKSIPDSSESNNLSSLPSFSAKIWKFPFVSHKGEFFNTYKTAKAKATVFFFVFSNAFFLFRQFFWFRCWYTLILFWIRQKTALKQPWAKPQQKE